MARHLIHVILLLASLGVFHCWVIDKSIGKDLKDLLKKDDGPRAEEKAGLFEGDIDMDESMQEALIGGRISSRDAILNPIYHWPYAVLYYKFDPSISKYAEYKIHLAMDHIERNTCVRFHYFYGQAFQNYVVFFKGKGCYSRIGRNPIGRRQRISIGRGCTRIGTIVHEIMHALGFFHEQSRQDRDKFIKIMWNNIKQKHRHNFRKYPRLLGTNLSKPYDYLSVMHYSKYAFSRNHKPTIVPRKKHAIIGQRFGLSYYDAYQINKLYNCHLRCVDRIHPFLCKYYKYKGYCHKTHRGRKVDEVCKRTCTHCRRYIHTSK